MIYFKFSNTIPRGNAVKAFTIFFLIFLSCGCASQNSIEVNLGGVTYQFSLKESLNERYCYYLSKNKPWNTFMIIEVNDENSKCVFSKRGILASNFKTIKDVQQGLNVFDKNQKCLINLSCDHIVEKKVGESKLANAELELQEIMTYTDAYLADFSFMVKSDTGKEYQIYLSSRKDGSHSIEIFLVTD